MRIISPTNRNLNPLLLQALDTYYKLPPEAWKPPNYKEFTDAHEGKIKGKSGMKTNTIKARHGLL
jgi:hypothetical protein